MSVEHIVRYTLEEVRRLKDETDWARIRAEEAAGIDPPFDDEDFEVDWASARMVMPETKRAVSVRLDAEVLAFFKAQGRGYQTRMNAVLRAYMQAQRDAAKRG